MARTSGRPEPCTIKVVDVRIDQVSVVVAVEHEYQAPFHKLSRKDQIDKLQA
jgi:hypothetical protein